jgi:hypothetical protein
MGDGVIGTMGVAVDLDHEFSVRHAKSA